MGQKVDISEVVEFSDELKTASEDIKSNLKSVEESIESISAMSSFSGKTANEAKAYFEDLHKTALTSFNGLFTDLDNQLKKHLQLFQSRVDTSESAIIESVYLNDTQSDINDDYEKLSGEQEAVRETIASVTYISSVSHPISFTLDSDKEDAIETITDLEEELASFTSEGKGQISQTEDLLHQIEAAINNAGAVKGDARFTDYKGNSTTLGLPALKGYNDDKREAELEKAREAKDGAVKDLNEASQVILNRAYTSLQNGEIDSDRYYQILSVLNKTKGDLSEEELNEEVPEGFVDYLNENRTQIARDLGVPIGASILQHKGTLKVGAMVQGFNAIQGPARPKSFQMVKPSSASAAKPIIKADNHVRTAGKAIGRGFIGLGFGIGMYDDMANNDKTFGEATTHNAAATGIGVGSTAGTSAGLTVAAAAVLGSNPVGWAAIGIAAVGTAVGVGATMGFNYLYDNNILGIQNGLDWAGQQIDSGLNWAGEQISDGWNWAGDQLDNVGEAFSSGLEAINPF